jgi:hypothetical protein
MKITISAIVCTLALGLAATSARADIMLAAGDAYYLGFINPSEPASPTDEAGYINTLITLAAGDGPETISGYTYDRRASSLPGPFNPAIVTGNNQVDVPEDTTPTINVTGFTYLLGKYDGPNVGDHVWYVGGLTDTVTIPDKLGTPLNPSQRALGLSHYTLFKSSSVPNGVPDGSVTLMLLGGALMSLEALRRRFRA